METTNLKAIPDFDGYLINENGQRDCGMKVVGEITTKTRTIDGTLITNQKQVVEQLEKYFRSKK